MIVAKCEMEREEKPNRLMGNRGPETRCFKITREIKKRRKRKITTSIFSNDGTMLKTSDKQQQLADWMRSSRFRTPSAQLVVMAMLGAAVAMQHAQRLFFITVLC